MKICDHCGRVNADSAEACSDCGKSKFDSPPPNLPISRQQKDWIEKSFTWLLNELGADDFLHRKTILPEQSFFPDRYQATEDCARQVVQRVCGYMEVDSNSIEVDFFSEGEDLAAKYSTGSAEFKRGPSGLYYPPADSGRRPIVTINESNLKNPISLVATAAHEIGHVILLGGGRITREQKDHEDLTDLITVFYGLGIFNANAAFQFSQWQSHSHQDWRASRLGYISEEMFAYSLACYAHLRREIRPDWAKYLAMNVAAHFKKCQKYFHKGGESNLPILKA